MAEPSWLKRFDDSDLEDDLRRSYRSSRYQTPSGRHGNRSGDVYYTGSSSGRRISQPSYVPQREDWSTPRREQTWSYIDKSGNTPSVHTSASYGDFDGSGSSASGSGFAPKARDVHSAPSSTLGPHERRKRRHKRDNSSDETYTSGYSTNSVSELSDFNTSAVRSNRRNKPYATSETKFVDVHQQDERCVRSKESRSVAKEQKAIDNRLSKRSESNVSVNSSDISMVSKDRSRKSADSSKTSPKRASSASLDKSSHECKSPTIGNVAVAVTNNIQYDPNDPFAFIQPIDIPFHVKVRKCMGPIMAAMLLLILAAALGAAIYFAAALKETQEKQIEFLQANLAMKIRGTRYVQNLDSLSQQDFDFLSSNYCSQMDDFYSSSRFRDTYRGCEVVSIKNRYINFTLFFVEKEATSSTEIMAVIESSATRIQDKTRTLALVDKFELELDSVKITIERKMEPETFNKIIAAKITTTAPTTTTTTATTTVPLTSPDDDSDRSPKQSEKTTRRPTPGGRATQTKEPPTPKPIAAVTPVVRKPSGPAIRPKKVPPKDTPVYSWDPCSEYIGTYFPHPTECDAFFMCNNGITVQQRCTTGLLYQWKELTCVSRFTPYVQCPDPSKAPPRPTSTTTATTSTSPTTTTPKTTPTTEPVTLSVFDMDEITTTKSPAPVNPRKSKKLLTNAKGVPLTAIAGKYPERDQHPANPCVNESVILYPHPDDCGNFIQCVHGKSKNMSCPTNLVFNPVSKACVSIVNPELVCPDIAPCRHKDDEYFSHPISCSKFIQCHFKKEVIRSCEDSLVWNNNVKSCMLRTPSTKCPGDSR